MKLNRLIGTGAGIIFKGSGFYQTDYRSDSYNKDKTAAKKSTETKTSETKSKSKDKTKPAPKKQTKKTA